MLYPRLSLLFLFARASASDSNPTTWFDICPGYLFVEKSVNTVPTMEPAKNQRDCVLYMEQNNGNMLSFATNGLTIKKPWYYADEHVNMCLSLSTNAMPSDASSYYDPYRVHDSYFAYKRTNPKVSIAPWGMNCVSAVRNGLGECRHDHSEWYNVDGLCIKLADNQTCEVDNKRTKTKPNNSGCECIPDPNYHASPNYPCQCKLNLYFNPDPEVKQCVLPW